MFDIGETVKQGVARAAERGVSFVTVHGDGDIIRAAAEGKRGSNLKILVVPVLTSLTRTACASSGTVCGVNELISGVQSDDRLRLRRDHRGASRQPEPDRRSAGSEALARS